MIEESVAAITRTRFYKNFPPVGMPMSFFRFFLLSKGTVIVQSDFVREAVAIASLRKVSRAMIFCLPFVLNPERYLRIDISIEPQ